MVLLIALIPAVLVYIIGISTKSKFFTILAAIAAGILGVLSGNPIFAGIDLLFVAIGAYFALQEASSQTIPIGEQRNQAVALEELEHELEYEKKNREFLARCVSADKRRQKALEGYRYKIVNDLLKVSTDSTLSESDRKAALTKALEITQRWQLGSK